MPDSPDPREREEPRNPVRDGVTARRERHDAAVRPTADRPVADREPRAMDFAKSQEFYNAGYAAGQRALAEVILDLPTVVPDHPHGGVHPPYLEWRRVADIAAALKGSSDD